MARGVGRGASGSELQQDTDLPQSTLAAQLVDRFTDGKKHSKSQDQETFQLLLREILGCERGQKARGEALENNKDVDCKLIYVIVKAGLEKPTFDDPFNGQVGLTKPVIDSMTAIEFTIRRNPEVLFAFLPNQEHESRSVGPLYMWLLPKVLAIIGSTDKKEVIDTALQVLKTALVTERKTHIKGLKIGRVLKYVKGCITGSPPWVLISSGLLTYAYLRRCLISSRIQSFGINRK